jgi:enamine deaminase RidA (YjgF/YER057c/UK114 family)
MIIFICCNFLYKEEMIMSINRYEGTGRMSRVVEHAGTLYLCGQTCGEAGNDIMAQTKGTLEKVEVLLEKYGSSREHILSTTIYLKNMDQFADMNSVWDAWVIDGFEPARACVEASMARDTILVEMSVVAAKK